MSSGNVPNDDKKMMSGSNDSCCTTGTSESPTVSLSAPNLSSSSLPSSPLAVDSLLLQSQPYRNGASRRQLVHSVSIIVEPVCDVDEISETDDNSSLSMSSVCSERRNTIAGPIVLEDFPFDTPRKAREEDDIVQSIIAHARLRKEEFARLLEEHAQIVNEINRQENSLLI